MISQLVQGAVPHWQAVLSGCSVPYIITEHLKLHSTWASPARCKVHSHIPASATMQPALCHSSKKGSSVPFGSQPSSSSWNCHTAKGRLVPQWLHPRPLTSLLFSAQSPIVKKRMALSNTQQDEMRRTAGADRCLDSVGELFLGSFASWVGPFSS